MPFIHCINIVDKKKTVEDDKGGKQEVVVRERCGDMVNANRICVTGQTVQSWKGTCIKCGAQHRIVISTDPEPDNSKAMGGLPTGRKKGQ